MGKVGDSVGARGAVGALRGFSGATGASAGALVGSPMGKVGDSVGSRGAVGVLVFRQLHLASPSMSTQSQCSPHGLWRHGLSGSVGALVGGALVGALVGLCTGRPPSSASV